MENLLTPGITTHQCHTPEISFLSDTEAEATWAMHDYVQVEPGSGRVSILGWGHYFETYRKGDDGKWRISSKRNVRLRLDEVPWTLPVVTTMGRWRKRRSSVSTVRKASTTRGVNPSDRTMPSRRERTGWRTRLSGAPSKARMGF